MTTPLNVLILGASYGSLLGTRIVDTVSGAQVHTEPLTVLDGSASRVLPRFSIDLAF